MSDQLVGICDGISLIIVHICMQDEDVLQNFSHIYLMSRHIGNIFAEGELYEKSNVHFLQIPN